MKRVTVLSMVICLVLGACSAPEPTATPVPPTPEIVEVLEVTFDGNECTCIWPEVITPGRVSLVLNNESQAVSMARMVKLNEGKTWDDMLSYMGPPPSSTHAPSWVSFVFDAQTVPGKSIARNKRLSGGLYGVVCIVSVPEFGVWPGAPLYVED